MDVAVFSTRSCERDFLDQANATDGKRLRYLEAGLSIETAAPARSSVLSDQRGTLKSALVVLPVDVWASPGKPSFS